MNSFLELEDFVSTIFAPMLVLFLSNWSPITQKILVLGSLLTSLMILRENW